MTGRAVAAAFTGCLMLLGLQGGAAAGASEVAQLTGPQSGYGKRFEARRHVKAKKLLRRQHRKAKELFKRERTRQGRQSDAAPELGAAKA